MAGLPILRAATGGRPYIFSLHMISDIEQGTGRMNLFNTILYALCSMLYALPG